MVLICLQCSHRQILTANFAFDGVLGFSVGFMIIARDKKSHMAYPSLKLSCINHLLFTQINS